MEDILKKFGDNGVFTACCVGFLSASNARKTWNWGHCTTQSLFDCASLTKVWPTGELIQLGFDEGWLSPDKKLEEYLPEVKGESAGQHTLHELHNFMVEWKITLSEQKNLSADELLRTLEQTQTVLSPKPIYSNATSIFLSLVLERVSGKRLDKLAQEKLFGPLELKRTGFFPKDIDETDIIPSEIDEWRGRELRGEVHDESAWILQQEGRVPGSAGLFSCMDDLLTLAKWQLKNSQSNGAGWERRTAEWIGSSASPSAYGKTGFTGTSVVIDPEKNSAVIILSNATYPHRPAERTALDTLRKELNTRLLA